MCINALGKDTIYYLKCVLLKTDDTDDEGYACYFGFGNIEWWVVRIVADETQHIGCLALHESFAKQSFVWL